MADDDKLVRHSGPNVATAAHASPYPVSRLAPATDLVDMAREIAEANHVIGLVTHAKLEIIASQIRLLQDQARAVLKEATANAELHEANCRFRRRVGHTYHLYRRPEGMRYFSLLAPDDWNGAPPHAYEGSFRLEPDMSWAPAGAEHRPPLRQLQAAIGVEGGSAPDE